MSQLEAQARECANLSQQLRLLLNNSTPDELALATSMHLNDIVPLLRTLVFQLNSAAYHSQKPTSLYKLEPDYSWLSDHGCGD